MKRRRFTAEFKARGALEALWGDKTIQGIAAKHKVHPNQVSTFFVTPTQVPAMKGQRDRDGAGRAPVSMATLHDVTVRAPGTSGGCISPIRLKAVQFQCIDFSHRRSGLAKRFAFELPLPVSQPPFP